MVIIVMLLLEVINRFNDYIICSSTLLFWLTFLFDHHFHHQLMDNKALKISNISIFYKVNNGQGDQKQ